MTWLVYTVACILFWAGWAFFGKVALRYADWVHVSLAFGLTNAVVFGILLTIPGRKALDASAAIAPLLATALCGAAGLAFFYLALDRERASVVVPMIAFYPVLTTLLAVAFLGEAVSARQVAGIVLALVGIVMLGLGS
jgi:transporter family protein